MKQEFWQSRYEAALTGWNIGDVSRPIKEYLDQLTDKNLRILIPGCGFAYEAIYAHRLGFKNVFVLDFVEEPLATLQINCPSFPKEHILQEDFFEHQGTYDLIIEQTLFCAIDPINRSKYVDKVHSLLAPGGKLVGLLFDRHFDGGPPFSGTKAEYQSLFSPVFSQFNMKECYNSIQARQGTEVFIFAQKAKD